MKLLIFQQFGTTFAFFFNLNNHRMGTYKYKLVNYFIFVYFWSARTPTPDSANCKLHLKIVTPKYMLGAQNLITYICCSNMSVSCYIGICC